MLALGTTGPRLDINLLRSAAPVGAFFEVVVAVSDVIEANFDQDAIPPVSPSRSLLRHQMFKSVSLGDGLTVRAPSALHHGRDGVIYIYTTGDGRRITHKAKSWRDPNFEIVPASLHYVEFFLYQCRTCASTPYPTLKTTIQVLCRFKCTERMLTDLEPHPRQTLHQCVGSISPYV